AGPGGLGHAAKLARLELGPRHVQLGTRRAGLGARTGRIRARWSGDCPIRGRFSVSWASRPASRVPRPACAEVPQLVDDQVEPLALDELHGVVDGVAVLTDLENGDNVGVVQAGRRAGLAAEPFDLRAVLERAPREDFEGDAATERDLLGLVHDAHATPTDLADDAVIADLSRRCGARRGRRPGQLDAPIVLDLLDFDQGGEQLANLAGQIGVAVGVLPEAGPLATAVSLGELLGEPVEQGILSRAGIDARVHHQVSRGTRLGMLRVGRSKVARRSVLYRASRPPGSFARTSLSRFKARM